MGTARPAETPFSTYKDFESDAGFDAALAALRRLVGSDEHVTEVEAP